MIDKSTLDFEAFFKKYGLVSNDHNIEWLVYALESVENAFLFVTVFLHNRQCSELEDLIITDAQIAFSYAKSVINGRWPKAEPIILKDPLFARIYAVEILKRRWLEAEPIIRTDKNNWKEYRYQLGLTGALWKEFSF